MPTYEYRCEACGHEFEKFQSITAEPIRECPKCGRKKCKRLIGTGAGLIFKGSGFYITDYRSDGYKSAAKSDSGSAASSSTTQSTSTTSSTTDSSPAPKAEPAAKAAPAKPTSK